MPGRSSRAPSRSLVAPPCSLLVLLFLLLLLILFSSNSLYTRPTRSPPSPSKSSVSVVETHITTSRRSPPRGRLFWLSLFLLFFPFHELIFSSCELTLTPRRRVSSRRRITNIFSSRSLRVPPSCQFAFSLTLLSPSRSRRWRAGTSSVFWTARSSKRGHYCYRIDASPVGRVGRER